MFSVTNNAVSAFLCRALCVRGPSQQVGLRLEVRRHVWQKLCTWARFCPVFFRSGSCSHSPHAFDTWCFQTAQRLPISRRWNGVLLGGNLVLDHCWFIDLSVSTSVSRLLMSFLLPVFLCCVRPFPL